MAGKSDQPHVEAVEKTIQYMKDNMDKPITLEELAKVASFSPYYYNRIFRKVTGLPPRQFLAALRLEKGKDQLLNSKESVTDITMDVGYQSFGAFTSRFKNSVGLAPYSFRKFGRDTLRLIEQFRSSPQQDDTDSATGSSVRGEIFAPASFNGMIFVGLFPKRIPDRRPVSGTALKRPGSYHLSNVLDGSFFVMAAALSWSMKPVSYLIPKDSLRGATNEPIKVKKGQVYGDTDINLRGPKPTDPPILVSLPKLLAETFNRAK